ncbi:MAG: porin [Roseiarcus sp.]
MCALWPLQGFAAEVPAPDSADKGASSGDKNKVKNADCSSYGPKFFRLGESVFCGKAGYDLMGFAAKDFASWDIGMVGQRLPSMTYPAGVPLLYYYNKNFSSETDNPYPGVDAQVNFMAVGQTEAGPLVGYVNLRLAGQLEFDTNGGARAISNNAPNGSALEGLVDQAWVRLGGLEIGVQPSMFGFARWGYSVVPGYSSLVDTPAISYTYRIDNLGAAGNEAASVSLALEDPTIRDMADGVLSQYAGVRAPDFVAQARFGTPSLLLHIGGALHEIRDEAARDCCGSPVESTWGAAGTVGGEYRVKWSDLFGASAGDMYGRFMIQGAEARGAIGYLGVPFFATDYVADADGAIHPTLGYSGIASYEHLWTPTLKSSLTFSIFHTSETSGVEDLPPGFPMWFDVKVRGSELQAGIEDMLQPDLMVGLEAGYTWTTANGTYAGALAAPLQVGFPNVAVYVRKVF